MHWAEFKEIFRHYIMTTEGAFTTIDTSMLIHFDLDRFLARQSTSNKLSIPQCEMLESLSVVLDRYESIDISEENMAYIDALRQRGWLRLSLNNSCR